LIIDKLYYIIKLLLAYKDFFISEALKTLVNLLLTTKKLTMKKILLIISIILFSNSSFASKGGLNKDGCHTDKETKKYHCHNKKDKKDKKDKKNKKNKKN